MIRKGRLAVFYWTLLLCFTSLAQDTLRTEKLNVVNVVATSLEEKNNQSSGDVIKAEVIRNAAFTSAGEAAGFLSGVVVKDYGGVGGMKTVSVRGLGAMHTNISYDGLTVSNNQNAQVDLSKFRIGNVETLSLSNGNRIMRLQTARSLSCANILNIETQKPSFDSLQRCKGSLEASLGSFNLGSLSALLDFKLSKRIMLNLFADVISCKGNFPYTLRYGSGANDSTSREIRQNNDLFSTRAEANLFYDISPRADFRAKAFVYYSERGLAGPTTLYWLKSKQRLWEQEAFLQGVYSLRINQYFDYKTHFKFSENQTRYLDPLYNNAQGCQDDFYRQDEVYLNNIFSWHRENTASLTLTNDLILSKLDARNNYHFSPLRFGSLTALIGAYRYGILLLDFNILHTYSHDWAKQHKAYASQSHFSPFVSLKAETEHFEAAVFFKDIFRLPTFNELYYNATGEVNLQPEKTKQYNLHLAGKYAIEGESSHSFALSIDLYHNSVTDKIVAIPRNNMFIWSMVNYGKAKIDGFEAKGVWKHERFISNRNFDLLASLSYNYSYAIDSDPNSLSYGNQIIYTPRHTGNAILNASWDKLSLCYTAHFTGKRYHTMPNNKVNSLPACTEHSISLIYRFKQLGVKLSCNNFTNTQYEIVRSYPMQSRSWVMNLKYNF